LHAQAPSRARPFVAIASMCLAFLIVGCRAPVSVQSADRGDWAGLRAAVSRERAAGQLDDSRVQNLARAVAEREILTATPEQAGPRIERAEACAGKLADALERRARGQGSDAAAAELALLDAGAGRRAEGARLWTRYRQDPNPLWRAVAARAQIGPALGTARRQAYVDPDERVRLAALRAALEMADSGDVGPLLEEARLDPNPLARALAARAAGGIASPQVTVGLRDLYFTADEGLRQSIVDAWARPGAVSAGGVRELEDVAANQRGAPAIEAATRLVQLGGGHAGTGTEALLRAMTDGLARDRVLAIDNAPLGDARVRAALSNLRSSPDALIRTAALVRLLEIPSERARSLALLRAMAERGVAPALDAAARAGDGWAIDQLARELSSANSGRRLRAAQALVGAGQARRAAELLGDADANVRMTFACSVLAFHAT
jgi:hypothetical protein